MAASSRPPRRRPDPVSPARQPWRSWFIVGFSCEEIAEQIGVSERVVKRDWAIARTWLRGEVRVAAGGDV